MPRKKKKQEKIEYSNKEEKLKALQKIVRQFNRSHDKELIKFGKEIEKERERISFGLKALDKLTGGGIPVGLFTVIWGNKSTGKTTLTYKIIAEAQKQDKIVAFFDLENTFDPDWAIKQGVNTEELVLGYFDTAEEAMDALIVMAENKAVDLVVIDSIQAMSPKGEQRNKSGTTRSIEEDEMALLARKLSKFFRITAPKINEGNIAVVMIGQARMDIGGFIALETLSGGRGLAHWASLIIKMRRGQNCYDEKTRILTKEGYKTYKEIKVGDLIPTVNLEKNKIEYKPIKQIFVYNVQNQEVHRYYNNVTEGFVFSPNHKLLLKFLRYGSPNYGKLYLKESSKINYKKHGYIGLPICFPSGNPEYPISDDEIRFLAWCLTDSYIKENYIEIYQSRKKYASRIRNLLKRLKINYKERSIVRCQVFRLNKETTLKIFEKYKISTDKNIPDWLYELSDRQAKVFLEEVVLADGSYRNKEKKIVANVTKKNKKFIEDLSRFCVTHNIPISRFYPLKKQNAYQLTFKLSDYRGVDKKEEIYSGVLYGIEVDNHLHFIERNGFVCITHNSDAPYTRIKDEKTGKSKKVIIGFDCVFKLEKKKVKSMPEGTEIHLPFIFEEGFEDVDVEMEEVENEE